MDASAVTSVIAAVISGCLALLAIWQARDAARESRENHNEARKVLAEIDKRAAVIQEVVANHQQDLLSMVRQMLPRPPEQGPEIGAEVLQALAQDPDGLLRLLGQMSELGLLKKDE